MIKAKRYILKAREYLSNFKKVEKKGGPPKLKVTTKKDRQSSCYRRNCFPPFCWSYGCRPCHHTLK